MMSKSFYPSQFVREAIGLEPVSAMESPIDTHCLMCAAPIKKGAGCTHQRSTPYSGGSFVDQPSVGARRNEYVCENCIPLWKKEYLQKYSKSLVTQAGLFKLATNEAQASLFLNPPDEPFMVFLSNAKQQHLIWRTPVNTSNKRYTVRVGASLLLIRQSLLLDAVEAQSRMLSVYQEVVLETTKKKASPLTTIFVGGDRELKSSGFKMHPKVLDAVMLKKEVEPMNVIGALNLGERFALSLIGWSKLDAPTPFEKLLPAGK